MFCSKFENQGVLYLYNELDDEDKGRFETHLQECSKCRMALVQLGETTGIYRRVEDETLRFLIIFLLKLRSRLSIFSIVMKNFISELFSKKRYWIPATVSSIAVILLILFQIGIFNGKQELFISREQITEWTILSDDSLNSLEQQINNIFADNFDDSLKKQFEFSEINFDNDLGLNDIEADIILLSWDINQSYF